MNYKGAKERNCGFAAGVCSLLRDLRVLRGEPNFLVNRVHLNGEMANDCLKPRILPARDAGIATHPREAIIELTKLGTDTVRLPDSHREIERHRVLR